jgi:glucose/mannose transport system substrate-binding protein
MRNCTPLIAIAGLLAIGQTLLTAEAADKDKLEVFSWWTSPGEAAALNGLFNVYKKQDPGVEIVNATIAGGGGSAARPVLQTRLAASNPPDSWQTHPGWELLGQYVEPGYCEPITELYKSDGWEKPFRRS